MNGARECVCVCERRRKNVKASELSKHCRMYLEVLILFYAEEWGTYVHVRVASYIYGRRQ